MTEWSVMSLMSKKASILKSSLELFAQNGYSNTSVDKIAKDANVSKGSIYTYFKSKDEILNQLIDEYVQVNNQFVNELSVEIKDSTSIEKMIIFYKDKLISNKEFYLKYYKLLSQSDVSPIIYEKIKDNLNSLLEPFVDFFNRFGLENPYQQAMIFNATMDGLSISYLTINDILNLEKSLKILIDNYNKLKKC